MAEPASSRVRFVRDASGRATEGALDAELVTAWLNVHGLTGAAVPAHARDVLAAIAEMDNPPGRGGGAAFSQFSPNPKRGGQPDVQFLPVDQPGELVVGGPVGQRLVRPRVLPDDEDPRLPQPPPAAVRSASSGPWPHRTRVARPRDLP